MHDASCDDSRLPKPSQAKFMPNKWKELTTTQYSKLTALERSRYNAVSKNCVQLLLFLYYNYHQYEPPPKHIEELQAAALKRICQVKQEERE